MPVPWATANPMTQEVKKMIVSSVAQVNILLTWTMVSAKHVHLASLLMVLANTIAKNVQLVTTNPILVKALAVPVRQANSKMFLAKEVAKTVHLVITKSILVQALAVPARQANS